MSVQEYFLSSNYAPHSSGDVNFSHSVINIVYINFYTLSMKICIEYLIPLVTVVTSCKISLP